MGKSTSEWMKMARAGENLTIPDKIARGLVYIWGDASNTSKRLTDAENSRHFISGDKGYFNIGKKGIRGYNNLFKLVKNNIDEFDEKFSKQYFEKLITDSIHKLIDIKHENIEEESLKEANKIFDELQQEFNIYKLSTPISNLVLDMEQLIIGNISFKLFEKPELPETEFESYLKLRERNESQIFPMCKNQIMATVQVKSIDKEKAKDIGKSQIEDSLNIIRFYGLNFKYHQSRNIQNYFDIKGKLVQSRIVSLIEEPSKHDEILPEISWTGYLAPFTISEDFFNDMKEYGLPIINDFLKKHPTKRTDIENRILSAVRLAGSSFMYRERYEAFLKLMIALEALLIDEREPKKENLSERVAFIITEPFEDRLKVYQIMKELYEIRSNIVHVGNNEVLRKDLIQLQYFTFPVIITMIQTHKERNINTINQLKEWILKQKFT